MTPESIKLAPDEVVAGVGDISATRPQLRRWRDEIVGTLERRGWVRAGEAELRSRGMAWHMAHQPTQEGIRDRWRLTLPGVEEPLVLEGAYATHRLDGNHAMSGFIFLARFEDMRETVDFMIEVGHEETIEDGLRRVDARLARFERLARDARALPCPSCAAAMIVWMGCHDQERILCGAAPWWCPGRRKVGETVSEDEALLIFLKRVAGEVEL